MIQILAIFLLLSDGPIEKPAWEWTLEERIAERTDPAKIRERVAAAGQRALEYDQQEGTKRVRSVPADHIDGDRDPALFLDFEVFDRLMRVGFARDVRVRDSYREGYAPHLRRLELPDDFWERLDAATADYRGLVPEPGQPYGDPLQICAARIDALARTRQVFGSVRFDRFLYEGLVPEMSMTTTTAIPAYSLRYLAGGCR